MKYTTLLHIKILRRKNYARQNGKSHRGGQIESNLWINPNPNNSYTSVSDIILSESIDKYDYIKFVYKATTTSTDEYITLIPVDIFKQSTSSSTQSVSYKALIGGCYVSNAYWSRVIFYTDSTHIMIGNCYNYASSSSNNANCIPLKIIGVK